MKNEKEKLKVTHQDQSWRKKFEIFLFLEILFLKK